MLTTNFMLTFFLFISFFNLVRFINLFFNHEASISFLGVLRSQNNILASR
jgi:hypothetical protein